MRNVVSTLLKNNMPYFEGIYGFEITKKI